LQAAWGLQALPSALAAAGAVVAWVQAAQAPLAAQAAQAYCPPS